MITGKNGGKDREGAKYKTYKLLEVFPVLPVETPICLPDPVPPRIVPCPGREEDYSIVGFDL